MIRNMTLGQYYKADSPLHALDPRVKLLGTVIYVVTLFFPKSVSALVLATVFLGAMIALSKVPFSMVFRGVKPLLILFIFTAVVNLLAAGGTVLVRFGPFHITIEGIWISFYLVVRLAYLVMGASIMTFTTTPNQLADGLEKGLGFLNAIRVPIHELAMMISIALRFIPILTEELDTIMKAQMSRGADFETGNLLARARKMIPVLVPLFVSAIRRASDLALAMDARCYNGGEGRTKYKPLSYGANDRNAYILLAVYVGLMVLCSFFLP